MTKDGNMSKLQEIGEFSVSWNTTEREFRDIAEAHQKGKASRDKYDQAQRSYLMQIRALIARAEVMQEEHGTEFPLEALNNIAVRADKEIRGREHAAARIRMKFR